MMRIKGFQQVFIICSIIIMYISPSNAQQVLYDLENIPIVDMHTHLSGKDDFKYCVKVMDEWGGTISVSVNRNESSLWSFIEDSLNGRILMAGRGNKFTPSEIQQLKDEGFVGLKTHLRYHTLPSEIPDDEIDKMGELNLPFIALHVADPPEDIWNVPDKFMVHQLDGERVVSKHSETTFIFAHGFYLTNRDSDIDTLRKFFDQNPNLYVDICCSKWWDAPQPSYKKLRKLLIEYKDRFLFGTDFNNKRIASGFKFLRERLETDKPLTFGNNGGPGPGLALPLDVINHIYYWNACRLIPGVKEELIKLGYEISDLPPKETEIAHDFNYDPEQITVISHAESVDLTHSFTTTIDVSAYGRTVDAVVKILDYEKNVLKILYKDKLDSKKLFTWDLKDKNGEKVSPGKYRVWLILDGNKCAETVFNIT